MPVAVKKTAAKKPASKVGKFALGYYYTTRGKKYVTSMNDGTYPTKEAALKAAEVFLNGRSSYYKEVLILEVISKVALERVPIKVVEVE